jgi:hypothetical protein
MSKLQTAPNMADPDGFYAGLLDLHKDRSETESSAINAKLILLLANHIGDPEVLREAVLAATPDT